MTNNDMINYVFGDKLVSTASQFPSFDSYVSHYLSPEASEFLSELYGYKGDFTESNDPVTYIEYLKALFSELLDKTQRPRNGMSEIIEALVNSAKTYGAKLFAGSEVISIEKFQTRFIVKTANLTAFAQKVVVATHPAAFMKVKGEVSEEIQRIPIFKSIKKRQAFKGAAVYTEAWWEKTGNDTSNLSLKPRQKFVSNSNCLGTTLPYG